MGGGCLLTHGAAVQEIALFQLDTQKVKFIFKYVTSVYLSFPLGNGPHAIFEFVKRTFSSSDHLNMATANERIAVILSTVGSSKKKPSC